MITRPAAPHSRIDPEEIPPHSLLTEYYERDRQDYVVDLFNRTAQHYDTMMDYYWDTVEKCVPPRRSLPRCAAPVSRT